MKLDATLGGIAALMVAGTFYTFALCMVEDVDDGKNISPEYYYNEITEDDLLAEAVSEQEKNSVPETPVNDAVFDNSAEDEEDTFDEEAVPAAVTAVPEDESDPEDEPAPVLPSEEYDQQDDDEDYPEEYDVDEYDDSISEAYETSVYAEDSRKDTTLDIKNEEIFISEEEEQTYSDDYGPIWEEPLLSDDPEEGKDIVITLFEPDESSYEQTDISVNVDNNSGTATSETFTARFDGAVQTVNAYDLICWIVNNEISASFSDEAIKAQAVAAYSYVKYHNVNGLTPSVLVKKNPSQRIKDMVSSVWGVCCYYNGGVAQTVYMASSSGYTADAKNVWGGSFPYLKSVACPFDAVSDPNYGLTMAVTEDTMRSYLERTLGITLSDDPSNWMTITGLVDGNYVSSINIDGQTSISGRKMREEVLNYKLRSTAFDISYSNGIFTFTTYGYGHGVGMSQNGANILAKQGYSYSEILKHYFTGIEVL